MSIRRGTSDGFIYVARVELCDWRNERAPIKGWKVGFSQNLPVRIAELIGTPGFELVAIGRGTVQTETEIHRHLSGLRVLSGPNNCSTNAREWYRDCDEFQRWFRTFSAEWRGSIKQGARSLRRLRNLWTKLTRTGVETEPTIGAWLVCPDGCGDNASLQCRCACRAVVISQTETTLRLRVVSGAQGQRTAKTGAEFTVCRSTGHQVEPRAWSWWMADINALRAFDDRRELNDAALRSAARREVA